PAARAAARLRDARRTVRAAAGVAGARASRACRRPSRPRQLGADRAFRLAVARQCDRRGDRHRYAGLRARLVARRTGRAAMGTDASRTRYAARARRNDAVVRAARRLAARAQRRGTRALRGRVARFVPPHVAAVPGAPGAWERRGARNARPVARTAFRARRAVTRD